MKVIYILGSGHCGSTLLDLLLGAHSKIFGAGEIHIIEEDKVKCTCGRKVRNCEFWSNIKNVPNQLKIYRRKGSFLFNLDDFFHVKDNNEITESKFLKKNENLLEEISNKSESEVIIDSSKSVNRLEIIKKSDEIEPFLIHLVRDGQANSWFYIRKYKKFFPYIFTWFFTNLKIEVSKIRFGGKKITVKYKDLALEPEKTIKYILNELGLEFEEEMFDFKNEDQHQVGGNRMKFQEDSKIYFDEKWRKEMPLWQRVFFNVFFGWLNLYYKLI